MEVANRPTSPYANVLMYGPPKTGKTANAVTAPGPILYANCDLENAMLYAYEQDTEDKLTVALIEEHSKGPQVAMKEILAESRNGKWATVVLDPIGELYRILLDDVSKMAVRPAINLRGDVAKQLERTCRYLCKSPVNFIVVAHELTAEGDDDNTVTRPFTGSKSGSLSGLGPTLEGMVDIIAYTAVMPPREDEDGNVDPDASHQFVAQLRPGKGRVAGDRFNKLPKIAPVNFEEWFTLAGINTTPAGQVRTAPRRQRSK